MEGPPEHVYDAVIVGGGVSGLAAAWDLRDRDIVVLEASDRVGGRIRSETRDGVWLNFGAHVFSGPESAAGRLIDETGTIAEPVPGRLAAVTLRGRIACSGPVESFPLQLPMSLRSRLALAASGARLRLAVARYGRIAEPRRGEPAAERQARMLAFMDDRSFSEFIGRLPDDVDAVYRATLTRSSGEPEQLAAGYGVGYFHLVWNRSAGLSRVIVGGSGRLIEGLAAPLGDQIRLGCEVTSVAQDEHGVEVRWQPDGDERTLRARAAVVATPAPVARRIVQGLPAPTAQALESVRYGPYAVVAFLTDERIVTRWDGMYALATPEQPFSMLFNMANVLRPAAEREPMGSIMAYAAADSAARTLELADDEIAASFERSLVDLLPHLRGRIRETVVQRWPQGLPYPHVGRAALQPALTAPLGRVHLAGDYLGTWYTETAAQTAAAAAQAVRAQLDAGGTLDARAFA
jgi:oxygen-dependent protoporphyrinogen oxidase